jgi:predicted Zn-dependent peptidase
MKRFAKSTLLCSALLLATAAQATVYFDREYDPLPLFSMQVMFPVGSLSKDPVEAAALALYSEILDDGTEKLDKQAYQDVLTSYGASSDFSVGRETSVWSLSFPIIEGRDYSPLMNLLRENWVRPRLNQATFDNGKAKLDAQLRSSLDQDMSLASLAGRRYLGVQDFKLYPIFVEGLKALTLDTLKKTAQARILSQPEVWTGYVGPRAQEDLAVDFVKTVFAEQGEVKKGILERSLVKPVAFAAEKAVAKQAIIVEKPGRSQTVVFVNGIFRDFPKNMNEELSLHFGGHVLGFSGLGSYFGDEIRNKRGLAYTVSPVQKFYLGKPAVGFLTNPVREKNAEALEVIADLMKSAYEEADVFTVLPDDVWQRQWQSFRFGHILDNSSVAARLALRMSVVDGTLSPELAKSKPEAWNASREDLTRYFRDASAKGSSVVVVVGDSKELRPLLEKNFPGYKIRVIGLQQTLSQKAYE